jgi:hypothetical protein
MDIGYFRITFQVNHLFRCARTGRNLRFQNRSGNDRARRDDAFGIPFTQGIPRFCRTVLALGSPCKARGAQEYDAPNGGSLDADSAKIGARRHLSMRSIGRATRRRSAKAVAGRFQGCESMISLLLLGLTVIQDPSRTLLGKGSTFGNSGLGCDDAAEAGDRPKHSSPMLGAGSMSDDFLDLEKRFLLYTCPRSRSAGSAPLDTFAFAIALELLVGRRRVDHRAIRRTL